MEARRARRAGGPAGRRTIGAGQGCYSWRAAPKTGLPSAWFKQVDDGPLAFVRANRPSAPRALRRRIPSSSSPLSCRWAPAWCWASASSSPRACAKRRKNGCCSRWCGRVGAHYVEDVPPSQLVDDAVRGILAGLDDYSTMLDEGELTLLEEENSGRFGGRRRRAGHGGRLCHRDEAAAGHAGGARRHRRRRPPAGGGPRNRSRGARCARRCASCAANRAPTSTCAFAAPRSRRRSTSSSPATPSPCRPFPAASLAHGYGYARISRFNNATAGELEAVVAELRGQAAAQGPRD